MIDDKQLDEWEALCAKATAMDSFTLADMHELNLALPRIIAEVRRLRGTGEYRCICGRAMKVAGGPKMLVLDCVCGRPEVYEENEMRRLRAIVKDLAKKFPDPTTLVGSLSTVCQLCGGNLQVHRDECPWRRAKEEVGG